MHPIEEPYASVMTY